MYDNPCRNWGFHIPNIFKAYGLPEINYSDHLLILATQKSVENHIRRRTHPLDSWNPSNFSTFRMWKTHQKHNKEILVRDKGEKEISASWEL